MKLLFVNDHKFYKSSDDRVYSGSSFPAYVWERYLGVFESITVASRGAEWKPGIKGLVESTNVKVNFDLFYEVGGGLDYFRKKSTIKAKLEKLLKEHDAVVIRFPSSIGMWCAEICRAKNIPYATEVVGCSWDATWNYGSLSTKAIAPYIFLKMKSDVRRSFASIYVTQHFLQKRYPNPKAITAYASNVEIDDFPEEVLSSHIQRLDETVEKLKIGIIGNLMVKYKGFDTAMKALAKVKQAGIKFDFRLVGGGDSSYVKELASRYDLEDSVTVIGRLQSGQEVFRFLDDLDLYLHPSKQEGLPRAVIEAMSRACPVLASTIAGIPELLDREYLHKPGDSNRLADQLISVLPDLSKRKRMATENFQKAKEYTNDILVERRTKYWSEVGHYFRSQLQPKESSFP